MSNETKVIIIDTGPSACEMAKAAKKISESIGFTIVDINKSVENFTSQMQKSSQMNQYTISAFSGLSIATEKLKISMLETPKRKSKYINKPQHNYKKR